MQTTFPALSIYDRCVLTAIALLLAVIALRQLTGPAAVSAQTIAGSNYSYLYVEPGTTLLRKPDNTEQAEGKVVIDLRNGTIWGFPTLSSAPYPVNPLKSEPPVSSPMYLGKFDFSKMTAR